MRALTQEESDCLAIYAAPGGDSADERHESTLAELAIEGRLCARGCLRIVPLGDNWYGPEITDLGRLALRVALPSMGVRP